LREESGINFAAFQYFTVGFLGGRCLGEWAFATRLTWGGTPIFEDGVMAKTRGRAFWLMGPLTLEEGARGAKKRSRWFCDYYRESRWYRRLKGRGDPIAKEEIKSLSRR